MARPKNTRKTARLSVSLDEKSHQTLCFFAQQDDVTLAWLIRRSVHEMIERRSGKIRKEAKK
jgi:hypothetical protein